MPGEERERCISSICKIKNMRKDMMCWKNGEILGTTKKESTEESFTVYDWTVRYRLSWEVLCMFILHIALLLQDTENPK